MQTKIPQWFYLSHVPRLWWELVLSLSAVTTWFQKLWFQTQNICSNIAFSFGPFGFMFWTFIFVEQELCLCHALSEKAKERGQLWHHHFWPPFWAGQRINVHPEQKLGGSVMFLTDIYWSFKDENAGSGSWLSLLSHKGHSQKILSSPSFGLWKITPKGRNSLLCRSLPSPCSVCWCRGLGWTLDLSVWDAWPSKTPQQCSQCSLLVQPVTLDLGEEQDNFPRSSSLVMLQEPGCSTRTQWTGEISTERTRLLSQD